MKPIAAALSLVLIATGAQAQSAREKYELSVQCGKQAAATFAKEWGSVPGGYNSEVKASANYENHYNSRLNKCFYLETSNFSAVNNMSLWDLNENKEYGRYIIASAAEGPVTVQCYVEKRDCKTEDEFRALIKQFMED